MVEPPRQCALSSSSRSAVAGDGKAAARTSANQREQWAMRMDPPSSAVDGGRDAAALRELALEDQPRPPTCLQLRCRQLAGGELVEELPVPLLRRSQVVQERAQFGVVGGL